MQAEGTMRPRLLPCGHSVSEAGLLLVRYTEAPWSVLLFFLVERKLTSKICDEFVLFALSGS